MRTPFGNLYFPRSFHCVQVNGCLAEVGRPHKDILLSSAQNHMGKTLRREGGWAAEGAGASDWVTRFFSQGGFSNFAFAQIHKGARAKPRPPCFQTFLKSKNLRHRGVHLLKVKLQLLQSLPSLTFCWLQSHLVILQEFPYTSGYMYPKPKAITAPSHFFSS